MYTSFESFKEINKAGNEGQKQIKKCLKEAGKLFALSCLSFVLTRMEAA